MFESRERIGSDLVTTLETLRRISGGRYACILDASGRLFETPSEPEGGRDFALRRLLEERRQAILAIPAAMASGEAMADVFEDWHEDQFLLAFLNGRVALVVACPDAQRLEGETRDLLRVWADRMLRLDVRYRLDRGGRGFFGGKPRLDVVVVGATGASEGPLTSPG
jgi:hypothetical protein